VESGLNDGIALPFVLAFAAICSAMSTGVGEWLRFGLLQLTLGPLAGAVVGYLGARLSDLCARRGWIEPTYGGIVILATALIAFFAAETVQGNGFIAVFVGGMVFGHAARAHCDPLLHFAESEGRLLVLMTFLLFGAVLLPDIREIASPRVWIYAVASLTVVRMLPIAISLIGSGLGLPSVLFLGWFGPRGLASILYLLLVLESFEVGRPDELRMIVVATVALSIVLHGLSAAPLARVYGRSVDGMAEETKPVSAMPTRA
jgi:NhaP-type Na+/H+ or K+/H+ antiporter